MKLDFFSAATRPDNEAERQAEVDRLALDTIDDPRLDAIVAEVRTLLGVPMGVISIVDGDRQLFIVDQGTDIRETARATAICAHGLNGDRAVRCLADLGSDRRFRFNPLVHGELRLQTYVGAPLVTGDGLALGALCGLDVAARNIALAPETDARLRALADQVVAILAEHRRPG